MNPEIVLINPPFNRIKPDYLVDASLARFEMDAINPGLLSIGSFLRQQGINVEILDFYREKDICAVELQISEFVEKKSPKIIGISNLSAYDYLDVLRIADVAKKANPKSVIVVGGQHASGLKQIVLNEQPSIDVLVEGQGEIPLLVLYNKLITKKELIGSANSWVRTAEGIISPPKEFIKIDLDKLPTLDYSMYPNAKSFTPFIEESRGCHLSCNYCNNSEFFLGKPQTKSIEKFRDDVENATSFFGKDALYAIMTPNFKYRDSLKKLDILKQSGIKWSTEISCDVPWHTRIRNFSESGMFLLNVGFESASPKTLERMNKVRNIEKYLDRAINILNERAKYDNLKVRFNIMIYAGDTTTDISTTINFLEKHSTNLDAIVCCPTIAYPGTSLYHMLDKIEKDYGAKRVITQFCNKTHHFPIDPSSEITFNQASSICLQLEERFSPTRLLSLKHNYKKYEGRI